jgi:RNA polymerase sigma factor for flagellar operon FliA
MSSLDQLLEVHAESGLVADQDLSGPLHELMHEGFESSLADEISRLPEREKMVMALYYEQNLNMKEIGLVLGVSESRVCQLHSQAVSRLRKTLNEWASEAT